MPNFLHFLSDGAILFRRVQAKVLRQEPQLVMNAAYCALTSQGVYMARSDFVQDDPIADNETFVRIWNEFCHQETASLIVRAMKKGVPLSKIEVLDVLVKPSLSRTIADFDVPIQQFLKAPPKELT